MEMEVEMKYELTLEEKMIEKNADHLRSVSGAKREKLEKIITKAAKNKAISLRISEVDLEMIRTRAEQEGLPYQTLINMVLHKYVTGELFDRTELMKILAILEKAV